MSSSLGRLRAKNVPLPKRDIPSGSTAGGTGVSPGLAVRGLPDLSANGCWHLFPGGVPVRIRQKYRGYRSTGLIRRHFRARERRNGDLKRIDDAPHILPTGLGLPRRELWMHAHLKELLVGVGAAFDFLSGNKPQAQRSGLEWLFFLRAKPPLAASFQCPGFVAWTLHKKNGIAAVQSQDLRPLDHPLWP
jgi:hypothetical protein